MTKVYFSTTDSAKAIRFALADAFPGVKFSVRSSVYSGGSSIRIRWTDGPTQAEVDAVTARFSSRGFDGSIDLGYTIDHYVDAAGKIVGSRTYGTVGSGGVVPSHDDAVAGATLVHFGSGYVFTSRDWSPELEAKILAWIRTRYGVSDALLAPAGAYRHAEAALADPTVDAIAAALVG